MSTDSDKLNNADITPEPVDESDPLAASEESSLENETLISKLLRSPIFAEPENGSRRLAEDEELDLVYRAKFAELQSSIQDISERKKYASRLFFLLAFWMAFVALCIVFTGFGNGSEQAGTQLRWPPCFVLSDSILIALLTGATINLIALFAIVAWYLFPKK